MSYLEWVNQQIASQHAMMSKEFNETHSAEMAAKIKEIEKAALEVKNWEQQKADALEKMKDEANKNFPHITMPAFVGETLLLENFSGPVTKPKKTKPKKPPPTPQETLAKLKAKLAENEDEIGKTAAWHLSAKARRAYWVSCMDKHEKRMHRLLHRKRVMLVELQHHLNAYGSLPPPLNPSDPPTQPHHHANRKFTD